MAPFSPYAKSCCLVPPCRQLYKSIWLDKVSPQPKWRLNWWLIWLTVLIKVNLVRVCIGLKQLPPVIWAPPAELGLPWILAEQEMVMLTLHDNILNVFITILCLPVGEAGHMDFTKQSKKSRLDCRKLYSQQTMCCWKFPNLYISVLNKWTLEHIM